MRPCPFLLTLRLWGRWKWHFWYVQQPVLTWGNLSNHTTICTSVRCNQKCRSMIDAIQVVLSTHGKSKKIWSSMLGMENRTTPWCSCECAHQEVVLVDFPACWCSFFPLPSSNGLATDCSTAGSSRGFFFMSCREVPKCRAKKWLCALDSSRMS